MQKLFLCALLAASIIGTANARVLRYGFAGSDYYLGAAVNNLDYTTASGLLAAAVNGDTVQVYPGAPNINLTKRLTFIGSGYYTAGSNFNANLNVVPQSSLGITLQAGSSGSVFIAMVLNLSQQSNTTVENIVFRNCAFSISAPSLTTNSIARNWQILRCSEVEPGGSTGSRFENLIIENSIISSANFINNTSTGTITNCIFVSSTPNFANAAFVVRNSVFTNTSFSPSNYIACTFNNNLFARTVADHPGLTGSGNNFAVNPNDVFIAFGTNPNNLGYDARFALKQNSPAIGAGIGGVDCGIFGGPNPYRLSGLAVAPTIYKLTAPSPQASGSTYTITFSARSNGQ
jgi:hypothetical protein